MARQATVVDLSAQFSAFDYSVPDGLTLETVQPVLRPYLRELQQMSTEELVLLRWRMAWRAMAREKQLPPAEFDGIRKSIWIVLSGRGFGKTMLGTNWLGMRACDERFPYAVIAPTHDDVRHTCFEGVTGLVSVIPKQLIRERNLSLPSVTLYNGSLIRGFAGDSPERMRGPQHAAALCDEIASWRYPEDAWSNLQFGLRLGKNPVVGVIGTPKPTPFIRALVKDKKAVVVRGTTYENRENLAPSFYDNVAKYEGTKIGRQELHGEILDPEEEGIVRRSQWRLWPAKKPLPQFRLIVMSLDTAFTERQHDKKRQENDPTACSVWGVFDHPTEKKTQVILLDCWEEWLGFDELVKRVKSERLIKYGDAKEPMMRPQVIPKAQRAGHTGKAIDIILIEEKGSGISLIQQLAKEHVSCVPYNPGAMDKLSRLHAVSPMYAHRRVWAVESDRENGSFKDWAEPLISQVCSYKGEGSVQHDDLLDSTTQALRLVMDTHMDAFTVVRDLEEEKRKAARAAQERRERRNPYG